MRRDVTAIIRSAGERTKDLCRWLLCEQIPHEQVAVVNEQPFSRALRTSFEIGIALGRPWTLCVDGDMLLRANGVQLLLNCAATADRSVFQFQGNLFDKILGGPRRAGPRLYRTSLLSQALHAIPADGAALRPETFVCDHMTSVGHPSVHRNVTIGLHDFEQYFRDIYRKTFVHARKHDNYMGHLEPLWRRLAAHDPDYEVALWGLRDGRAFDGTLCLDVRRFPRDLSPLLSSRGWREKNELTVADSADWDVDKLIIAYGRTRALADPVV